MVTRIIAFLGLSLVFVAGMIAVMERVTVAQVATPPEAGGTVAQTSPQADPQAAPIPAAPAAVPAPAVAPVPAPAVAPAAAGSPPVTTPSAAAGPSIITVPTVVTAPPATNIPPVVTTPAPAVAVPAPVVVAPPAVSAPPAPAPVVMVPTPLPPEKPAIEDTKKVLVAAKTLFAAEKLPSLGKAMAIGYYPRGCLSGGVALPVNGPTWQVMRVSRNRNWGHPSLVRFLEEFAPAAAKATGWKGILVGDMAQPRGGPTPFGHRSHQTGLDVDVWFMPMPGHVLSKEEREKISAINLVADDWKHLNPKTWTPQHVDFIRVAAEQPAVERVLVNAAIKKEMCRVQGNKHPEWMDKVRPWYGHHDHIHVRLKCPADSPNCRAQPPVSGDDGCSDKALAFWFSDKVIKPKPAPKPTKPPRPVTMADLPAACKTVLAAPERAANN